VTLLDVRELQAGYGSSEVLFDVSLSLREGELVTLLGRNGMGKTTTINALMGLIEPRGGEITLRGQSIRGWPSYRIARAGLAMVPEGRQIFPNLTARENLIATAVEHAAVGEPWTLPRVLELFPTLEPRLDSMGNLLSGGEQQMLAIGRALMTNPRVLLLDDATEGLAPQVRREIWRCLAQLKTSHLGILVVDKHIEDLIQLTDQHNVIEKGRIVWRGDSAAWQASKDIRARYLGL